MLRFLTGAFALLLPAMAAFADVNPTVKDLMVLIRPAKASKKANPGDFKSAQERMIGILEFLEHHAGRSGINVESLLINAFYIYERDRFSGHRRMMTEGAILTNWKTARELGLFDEKGNFGTRIRNGREKGKTVNFEYIVPAAANPVFSTDLSNLRIVTPATKRKKGEGVSPRDQAYHAQLKNIEKEVLYGPEDEMGRTAAENLALWKGEVEKAGNDFKREPVMDLFGKVTATPSGKSLNRWRVTFKTTNNSRHPTQVKVEYYVFGTAEKGDKDYLLARKSELLRLRSSQRREIDVWTDERVGAVNLRGWVIRVLHNGKVIEREASQPIIYEYLDRLGSLPRMSKKKRGSRN